MANHGLIKPLVEDALHTYTIPIAWDIFRNMSRDDDIKTLTEDINASGSKEEEEEEEIEEEVHEETSHSDRGRAGNRGGTRSRRET